MHQEIIEIPDDDDLKPSNNNKEDTTGEEHVMKKGIVVKTMKDGKTMLIFSGDRKEMASISQQQPSKHYHKN